MSQVQRAIRAAAADNRGTVARGMVLTGGGTDRMIGKKLESGEWEGLHPGVYRLDASPPVWRDRVLAAVLACGVDAAASHRAAAVLFGLDGISQAPVEITVPHDDGPCPDGVILHRSRRELPIVLIDRIPTVGLERTLLDLAARSPNRILEKLLTSALYKRLTTEEALLETLAKHGGRGVQGTRRFRAMLRSIDAAGLPRSPAEVDMARIIGRSRVPAPTLQHEVRMPNGDRAFIDFAWPDQDKLVEVDSILAHSTPDQLDGDLKRQNMLIAMGFQILRFTARQIRDDPEAVRGQLERFVGEPTRSGRISTA